MVLLHGLRAYGHWFDDFADVAKPSFRLLAPDQRGRGESDWAPDRQYSTDAYVADLAAFADALIEGPFILGGHSMGGANAINYTAAHPDRVKALLILDTAPELNPVGLRRIQSEVAATPAGFDNWDQAEAFLRALQPRASDRQIKTRLRWMLKESPQGKIVWRLDPAIFESQKPANSPEKNWALLKSIACPTLILRGANSDIVTAEIADRMQRVIAGSRRAEIPGAAHMVVEDNPAAFNEAVMTFLQTVG
jgi:pimeloyl-ACP methyl ester carboxylesterase